MKVHFIAIGGSAMHNLALALHESGYQVSGSDDEIFEPSKGRLQKAGLLPEQIGWHPERVSSDLDAVILGMHARKDNPELARARDLGLKIYSYPEYLYECSKDKIRVVIGGSHGKTSITSMILHVLHENGIEVDYMVGAQLEGFNTMVRITERAKYMVLEGDEYLSSPIDLRPKFHLYQPHIALLSGVAWDHINVFPTFENYVDQFRIFTKRIEKKGKLIYFRGDPVLVNLAKEAPESISTLPYSTPEHKIVNGQTVLIHKGSDIPLHVFGEHNLQNLEGARLVLKEMGIEADQFYSAIKSFSGASKRLEKVFEAQTSVAYKDFAHSPSKLKATTTAVKNQFPERRLIACMELHTFSSLNKAFLSHYKDSMKSADEAIVYYNPKTLEHKKLPPISPEMVKDGFGTENVTVLTDTNEMQGMLRSMDWNNSNLLLMSSGNFDGIDLNAFAAELLSQ
jgi:UDP-N-acetylmuramate: L-alanyl-gamma-D-glutamyl-meso-diaminopimelate ligase